MKINKMLIMLVSAMGLLISLNQTAKAATPLPPSSLPLTNVFAVPTGANSYVEGNTTVVTQGIERQVGAIFSTKVNKMDLNQSFHAEMYIYLGNKRDKAADGMTFVMHADEERVEKFTGISGGKLGVYAATNLATPTALQQQIKKSFVVEFDTYLNFNNTDTDKFDKDILLNNRRGHVAYAFPDMLSSYTYSDSKIESLIHRGLYYPTDYLSNDTWHPFSVDWNADTKILTYKLDNAPTVSVPIDPISVFGTTSVYWGFTASTGSTELAHESSVVFKQIPGLVNASSSMKVTKNGKDIENTVIPSADGDVKVQYDLKYNGGKQNLLKPVFNLELDEFLSFKPGTLTVNGTKVSDNFFVNGKLAYNLPMDLTELNNSFTISFEGTPKIVKDKDTKTTINYSINAENYFGNNLKTEFSIEKANVITSSYFENQTWLIDEINRQLTPKKIDVDVYKTDLFQITKIDLTSAPKIIGEHIPKTIDSLINLNDFRLANQKLTGVLPEELGNLVKLTNLSIYGNTFDSEIPLSIGNLQQLTFLALNDNNLKGTVSLNIPSLPKLSQVYLNENKLSGKLPGFRTNMALIDISNTQLTYSSVAPPFFLTNAKSKDYSKTFIEGLKLSGNSRIASESRQIKPFDKTNDGYFDLKAMDGAQAIDLVEEHTYIIQNAADGTVYYNGKKYAGVTIPYENGISYTVILDEAERNPNNVFTILGKDRELKFAETPVSMGLKVKLGAGKQPVIPEGKLAIFDDRENKNWKLSITPNDLTQGKVKLQGEYSYTGKDGVDVPLITGQKFLLETGESDSINEIIQVSNSLGTNYGLNYTAYLSNYIGNYQGDVIWTLEDAP